jgi:hypothetical protein
MKARDAMTSPVITVKPSTSVQELPDLFSKARSVRCRSWTIKVSSLASSVRVTLCTAPRLGRSSNVHGGLLSWQAIKALPPTTLNHVPSALLTL